MIPDGMIPEKGRKNTGNSRQRFSRSWAAIGPSATLSATLLLFFRQLKDHFLVLPERSQKSWRRKIVVECDVGRVVLRPWCLKA